ncbi:alpha-mannosidase 2-like [Bacillus rossius redtenbacheri]|uniref:alpha-mannosidase 2-like n=1 Tax=Bacillus rossius redtenbacheri TaxID=93214 RepID=UPI002FDD8341
MKKVVLRRSSARYLAFGAILFTALLFLYYGYNTGGGGGQQQQQHRGGGPVPAASRPAPTAAAPPPPEEEEDDDDWQEGDWTLAAGTCPSIRPAQADVDTVQQFNKFDFQPYWMKSREYWDANFEERYKARKEKWPDLPLKVILVPHSHNDPGWLKTYESYYHYQTRNILNNMVDKLQAFPNMTFIWSEVSFFAQWWESAHPTKRRVVRRLLEQGRLEIMTGGWVMTDEATVHMYAMLDQLIEGHLWVKNNLGVVPRSGWSVDPFGHGSTVPYMLRQAGVGNTVIQRVHYAWKQWLAQQQMGDFLWRQNWDEDGHTDILTHNQPFDIYSIKHSCGPHPQVCLNFDFRKIPGEYTEYSLRAVPIDEYNVRQKAELLLEQYGRTGSLFPHNVVMMPLGDDFRYDHEIEWDQQYHNYKRLFDYINQNKERYHAEVMFGTPSDYFTAVKERSKHFPTLKGDFYVYSDIFSEGRPAYWSGYFTTRPYWKILDREVEASLRSAEILYTLALNRARQHNFNKTAQLLERDFERIIKARRSLALFQHHDAITGTSKAFVMHDYGLKLFEALQDTMHVQSHSAQTLLVKDLSEKQTPGKFMINRQDNFLLPDTDRESYEKLPQKLPLMTTKNKPRRIVLFNPLAQQRQEVVKIRVTMPNVRVIDSEGNAVQFQINPVWNFTTLDKIKMDNIGVDSEMTEEQTEKIDIQMSKDIFEVMFIANLPGLSLVTYTIERVLKRNLEPRAIVYCASCGKNAEDPNFVPPFVVKGMQAGDIQLENHRMKLLVDGHSGFLKAVTRKATGHTTQCGLQFSAYPSAQFHSGAYLFMPDPNAREAEREVLSDHQSNRGSTQIIIITSGPVASELTVVYHPLLTHSIRIYHTAGPLSEGMYIENTVDFEAPPKNRETELFMRVVSDISNGDPPEFYSDLNGFQMQRREKVERIGIEGNYFPVTSMAYIQDAERRLSLLVSHAQGAASWQPGWLEVMLDRRTLYDDSRGMGEGVVDNKRMLAKFWLLLEEVSGPADEYSRPSLFAHHLSNGLLYPASLFVVEGAPTGLRGKVSLLTRPFPCDVHLVTLRATPDPGYMQFPSGSALMVLHRVGYSCSTEPGAAIPRCSASDTDHAALRRRTLFRRLRLQSVVRTSLTGLHAQEELEDLGQVLLRPMQLVTLNVTFVL